MISPFERVQIANQVLTEFFTKNGLPIIQLDRSRCRTLEKWFSQHQGSGPISLSEVYSSYINISFSSAGNLGSITHCYRVCNLHTTIGKLPAAELSALDKQLALEATGVKIEICHKWHAKRFLFNK